MSIVVEGSLLYFTSVARQYPLLESHKESKLIGVNYVLLINLKEIEIMCSNLWFHGDWLFSKKTFI